MNIDMEVLNQSFILMGFGMGGVFVVLMLFYVFVKLLGVVGKHIPEK